MIGCSASDTSLSEDSLSSEKNCGEKNQLGQAAVVLVALITRPFKQFISLYPSRGDYNYYI